ncbi:MAG: cation:proton antiporter [Bacteroidetes bacterium]|jgi:Kef-type K+ transport system membrane component KefB|nr:cation:proton antiporter [Bacteroidota bacterium]
MLNSVMVLFSLDNIGAFSLVIGGSIIIILSYFANLLAKRTNIPSVLVLIGMGVLIRQGLSALGMEEIPYESLALELLGTVGLIFILLEAALDLELSKKKLPLILKSASLALFSLGASTLGIAALLFYSLGLEWFTAVVYAIPLSIMSSAIIIPSVGGLSLEKKEFMVYESTFSDIWGIMAFYLVLGNQEAVGPGEVLKSIGINLGASLIISIAVSYLLVYVLQKITSSVKLFLSIAVLILIYSIQKMLHLSPLILILIFGLMLNNHKIFFANIFKNKDGESWLGGLLNDEKMAGLRHDFHLLTLESAFVIRTFFFVLFGATVVLASLTDIEVLFYGLTISVILYVTRFVFLRLFRPEDPVSLLYIAPRGLITILLFFQIGSNYPELVDTSFNGGILLVVILVTCIIMTVSLIQKGTGIEPVEVNKGQHLLFEAKAENSNLPEDVQPSEESPE